MGWLAQVIGMGLVLLAIADIYMTVLYPRGDKGIVSLPLSRGLWQLFRLIARATPKNRNSILSYMGPTLMVVTIVVWILLYLIGFALIYWPALGSEIQMESGETPTDFLAAIYYSGFTFSTLGTGDITPQTNTYRLLMILQALLGFSTLTMTLTYLESVYSQLIQRNVFALNLHQRTARTADAAEMLARFGSSGSFDSSVHQNLTNMTKDLLNILESHHSYPALGYFRMTEVYYALAQMTWVVMDTVTLIRSALNEENYRSLVHSSSVTELEEGGMQFLMELSNSFIPRHPILASGAEQMWRERYDHAVQRLETAGIEI